MLQSPTTPCQFDMWDTTPGQFDMWKNADVPRSDVPLQLNLVVQKPTTPGQFDPLNLT